MGLKHERLLFRDPTEEARCYKHQIDDRHEPRVAILMSLYNGARFLEDQLLSIAGQTHRNWSLLVRDDGSRDNSVEICRRFAERATGHDIRDRGGTHLGCTRSFLTLLHDVEREAAFAAFSDQDDVWAPEKLERALSQLTGLPAGVPALYCSRTILTDSALNPRRLSPLNPRRTGFRHALVQNIAGGNTMVFNRAALDILDLASGYQGAIPAHDWWCYQVVSGAGGIVIHDETPMVFYRQHGRNLTGSNRGTIGRFRRMKAFVNGQFAEWTDQNIEALQAISPLLTPMNAKILGAFSRLRRAPFRERLRQYRALGLYRQTTAGNAALTLAVAAGRI